MANRETNTANAAITTLTSTMGPTDLTATVDSTTDFPSSPCYVVVDPDDDTKREIVYFDGTFTSTTLVTSVIGNRYLAGSAAGSGITHDPGATVIVASAVSQLWTDINDRVDLHAHGGGSDGAQVDHGGLAGLADDDHTQYHNTARHDAHDHSAAAASIASGDLADHNKATHDALALDHGSLSGLADFTADHGTGHDAHDHSAALASASLDDLGNLTAVTKDLSVSKVTTAGGGSASDLVVDFGNSYAWYQDNTGPGSSGDRSWFATPDGGALYVGPRGGGQYLDHLEFRAEVIAASDANDTGSLPIYTGTNGDVTGTAPAIQGDNYYVKAGYANGTTNASGQLSVTFGGGAFPNGVVSVVATAVTDGTPTRHITVGTVTTSGATFTFYKTGDGTVLASDSAGVHYFAVGF